MRTARRLASLGAALADGGCSALRVAAAGGVRERVRGGAREVRRLRTVVVLREIEACVRGIAEILQVNSGGRSSPSWTRGRAILRGFCWRQRARPKAGCGCAMPGSRKTGGWRGDWGCRDETERCLKVQVFLSGLFWTEPSAARRCTRFAALCGGWRIGGGDAKAGRLRGVHDEFAAWRMTPRGGVGSADRGMGAPADLALRLRLAISHERAKARFAVAGIALRWCGRTRCGDGGAGVRGSCG